jgi:hypothetical protein
MMAEHRHFGKQQVLLSDERERTAVEGGGSYTPLTRRKLGQGPEINGVRRSDA